MPLKKIDGAPGWRRQVCLNPEHNPPAHMVYEPGTYEYTCPGCGRSQTFTVAGVYS